MVHLVQWCLDQILVVVPFRSAFPLAITYYSAHGRKALCATTDVQICNVAITVRALPCSGQVHFRPIIPELKAHGCPISYSSLSYSSVPNTSIKTRWLLEQLFSKLHLIT